MPAVNNIRHTAHLAVAWALLAAAPVSLLATPAGAQEPAGKVRIVIPDEPGAALQPKEVNYIVAPGDTLTGIAKKLLRPDLDWRYLRAVNGLNDARQLVPGQRLRIPANWLKDNTVKMRVDSVSGKVRINGKPASANSALSETDVIETGSDGTVLVTLPDGTEMQIAPSSQVRIERLRQYFGHDALDARLRLEKGGVNTHVTPSRKEDINRPGTVVPDIRTSPSGNANPAGRFQIDTPKATATVRGTQFRVIESDALSSSAVLEGNVRWSTPASQVGVGQGFGSTANEVGEVTAPEKLLAAPVINTERAPVTNILIRIPFDPIEGAVAYRVRIAGDEAFTRQVTEQIVEHPALLISSERDGDHYVAVRGISGTGVEGYDGKAKVSFEARPVAPNPNMPADKSTQFSRKTTIKWLQPEGVDRFRLQIANDPDFRDLAVDHETDALSFDYQADAAEAAPRRRWWRVASIDKTGQGPWSASSGFIQRDPGPASTATVDSNGATIRWPEIPEATYIVLIKPMTASGSPAREIKTTSPQVSLTDLAPGRYEIRTVAEFEGGLRSPPGEGQLFTIDLIWRDQFGNAISGSGEEMMGIQPE